MKGCVAAAIVLADPVETLEDDSPEEGAAAEATQAWRGNILKTNPLSFTLMQTTLYFQTFI